MTTLRRYFGSLGFAKSQESRDTAGRAFFTVRSGSLDSISTALSLTTQQSGPARSCSLDSLHLQNESSRVRVQDGRQYMSLETGSVTSSRTTDAEQRGTKCTRSLPAAEERSVQCNSPSVSRRVQNGRDPDGFSDNFVTADDEEGDGKINTRKLEARRGPSGGDSSSVPTLPHSGTGVAGKSSLRKTQVAKEKKSSTNSSSFPEIPAGLLKLSPDELNELVTFTAATFQQSLQENLVYTHQRLLGSTEGNRGRDSPPAPSTTKHVRINEGGHHHHARQIAERGGCLECRQVRNKRRTRRERPTSMPPIYMRESEETPQNAATTITTEDDLGSSQTRSQSKDQKECQHTGTESTPDYGHEYSRRTYEARPPHRKCRCQCNSRGRRKRAGRVSGCDTDMTRDCHVDTSIDDNCPGLPENRIRTRHHHRYHHHHNHRHSVCERCLESLGDERHAHRQKHRHGHELPDKEGDTISAIFRDEDGTGFVTLDQLKTAGLLMKRSSGYGSGGSTGERSSLKHSESFNQPKPRAKPVRQGSFRLEDVPTQSIQVSNFQELIYPVRSRTGRDSPATDMAVANLDLNSSEMLVPVRNRTRDDISGERNLELHQKQSSDTTLNNNSDNLDVADGGTVAQTYLHKHHHFHHIIHHSQS